MGTLISALTGSDDPKEVAVMAKQAVDVSAGFPVKHLMVGRLSCNISLKFQVVNLISTVFEALRTSIF
jgi:hypothetical protein